MSPPKTSIAQLLQQGQFHHQQGRPDLAEACYRQILERQPRSFEALHLLGMLKLQAGDPAQASALLLRAAKVNPVDPVTQTLLGIALQGNGDGENALKHFQQAVKLAPRNPELHYNLGKALRQAEQFEAAANAYQQAVKEKPDYHQAWNNLSESLLLLERAVQALDASDKALSIHPDFAEALSNKGGALLALDRPAEALVVIDKSLSINPALPRALQNKASALAKLKRFDDALGIANHAVELQPDSHEAFFCRGIIYSEMYLLREALADFNRALLIHPASSLYLVTRGSAYFHLLEFEAAQRDFVLAININNANETVISTAHSSLSTMLLLRGEFGKGWEEFGWRWMTSDFKGADLRLSLPRWDGTPTKDHVLVWREQGLGDQILFASMLGDAAKLTGRLSIALERRLHALFARSFPNLNIVPLENAGCNDAFDLQIPLGDLGRITRPSVTSCLNNRQAYLKADSKRTIALRKELQLMKGKRLICGLSWSSKHKSLGDAKSMSLPSLLPILTLPDCHFVDLQYGDTSEERGQITRSSGVEITRLPSIDNMNDIDGLAALIDACDLVITISNTTAHLAGALGKKVFLMLPNSVGRFWCWQLDREDSLWYPNVRIFRQTTDGDWAPVIAKVRQSLEQT